MLVLELIINALARTKLEARGITRRDAEQVIASGPLIIDNPQARVIGSVLHRPHGLGALLDARPTA